MENSQMLSRAIIGHRAVSPYVGQSRRLFGRISHDEHGDARRPVVSKVLIQILILLGAVALAGCGTVGDIFMANGSVRHAGRASVVVDLSEQRAYLLHGRYIDVSSPISSGREGYRTPVGRFSVIRKDEDHRSSVYGDYVDDAGRVVKPNVDVRKDSRPRGSHFVGAPMPFFVEFSPGYGLHAGYLPGVPASHGCIRLPKWKARQFYNSVHLGTRVLVRP